MDDMLAAFLGWLVPIAVGFVVVAIAVAVLVWALRRARRSPRARTAAESARMRAGAALVRLDDAVEELEVEAGLSGALSDGDAPVSLRRARLTAQHAREASFEEFRAIGGADAAPDEIRRSAARIEDRADEVLSAIRAARSEHDAWVRSHVPAARQVASAQDRLARVRASMGDPAALVSDLSSRFDPEEWEASARAASAAVAEAADAQRLLTRAAAAGPDPTTSSLADMAAAERALRRSESNVRALEESHRLALQAAQALPGEFDAARSALRHARTTRDALKTADADRLGAELREIDAELVSLETDAARRPLRTVHALARLRERLDCTLGDAPSVQQRLRGARTALPGTLAAARAAVVRAEASVAGGRSGADARSLLRAAQAELAGARQAQDPVEALDAARRAMRHAEDASALADGDLRT